MIKSSKKGLSGVQNVAVAAHFSRICNRFKEAVKLPLPVCFKVLNIFRDHGCHCSSLILHNVDENEQNLAIPVCADQNYFMILLDFFATENEFWHEQTPIIKQPPCQVIYLITNGRPLDGVFFNFTAANSRN